MKKHLIAVLLTACLLFSFGTTAFAEASGEQTPDTDGAGGNVTQNSTEQDDEGILLLDGETEYEVTYKYMTDDGTEKSVKVKANAGAKYEINQSPTPRKDYIFTTWKGKVNGKEKTYENGDKIKLSGNIELVAQWDEKKGHFGYYLSDSNAHWVNMPTKVEAYIDTENGKKKYREKNAVAHDDTTTVTSEIPELEGHVFLGWGDKERTGTGPDQAPEIRKGGDTVTYYYKNDVYYTLDALWGSLTVTGDTKVYDGKRFELNPAVLTLNDNGLSKTLSEQYYSQLTKGSIEYSTNNTDESSWTTDLSKISFTDVGTHTLYVRQEITDGANQSRVLTTQATYTITPRPVTLTSASDTKEYDGKPLTNDTVTATVTAEGKGFVEGQGVTITVTGTQTEVGFSDNTFTYEPKDNNTNLSNYEITPNYGTLTVTKKTTPDPAVPNPNPNTTPIPETTPTPNTTPTPTPVVTPAPTAAPSTDDTTPENTATPAPTATAAPTATPAPAPTAAPAAARVATTIPQTGDNFPAVALVIVMLAAIVGLGITVVLRTAKKK